MILRDLHKYPMHDELQTTKTTGDKSVHHLDSRWRNSHLFAFYPLPNHLLEVVIAIYFNQDTFIIAINLPRLNHPKARLRHDYQLISKWNPLTPTKLHGEKNKTCSTTTEGVASPLIPLNGSTKKKLPECSHLLRTRPPTLIFHEVIVY